MKLAGITIIRNNHKFDYNVVETINSLLGFCDEVFVLECGSTDQTGIVLFSLFSNNSKVKLLSPDYRWDDVKGKERLSFFTNLGVDYVKNKGYDYQFYLQADEIVHEASYKAIREAILHNHEAIMCSRINLWGSPYRYLTVPIERQPCSTEVIRLTKTGYQAYDDAENIGASPVNFDYVNEIRIYHMGFVRRRSVMKNKIINMQCSVFGMEHYDPKLDMAEQFDPWLWFDKEKDTAIINEPLPEVIREWAKERAKDYE